MVCLNRRVPPRGGDFERARREPGPFFAAAGRTSAARLPEVVPARLNIVTLGVGDLAKMRDFYGALGWRVVAEAEDFCGFELRGAVLALFPREKLAADGNAELARPQAGMRGFTLAIVVDRPEHVDEIIAEVERAGGTVTKPPTDPEEFKGRHAYFADPEENYWEVAYSAGDGPLLQAIRRANG